MPSHRIKLSFFIVIIIFSSLSYNLLTRTLLRDGSTELLGGIPARLGSSAGYNWTNAELITTTLLSTSSNLIKYLSIEVDVFGNVHLIWCNDTTDDGDSYEDIFYKMYNFTTGQWTDQVWLTPLSNDYATDPAFVVDELGNVYVAWEDESAVMGDTGTYQDIFYQYLDKSTGVWSGHTGRYDLITPSHTYFCRNPAIAVDSNGNVHIVWEDNNDGLYGDGPNVDIFYKCWNSTTTSWSAVTVVSNDSRTGNSYEPCIAVDSQGNVHVAWYDYTDYGGAGTDTDIFYRYWNATTGVWSGHNNTTDVVSIESTTADSEHPDIAVDEEGNVYIVWDDKMDILSAGTDEDIFCRCWNASIGAWSSVSLLSNGSNTYSTYPSIATDTVGNIYVVWDDRTSTSIYSNYPYWVFYCLWNQTLSAWDNPQTLYTGSTYRNARADITVESNGTAHVAWVDAMDPFNYNYEIYYERMITRPPRSPVLAPNYPNPTPFNEVELKWADLLDESIYYVYRNTSFINDTIGLTPIATLTGTDYVDKNLTDGVYYYAVMAGNGLGNGSLSNCESVTVAVDPKAQRIIIQKNSDFAIYASSGNGSVNNPWIIENYYTNAYGKDGVNMVNTTDHFILRNITIIGAQTGFLLDNAINGKLLNNTVRFSEIGFHLLNAMYNQLINNTAYNNSGVETYSGLGFFLEFSDNNYLYGNYAFNNSGISGLSYSGNGFFLRGANYNNLTKNVAFNNFHYNSTNQWPNYGGNGFLGLQDAAYNNFTGNIVFNNHGFISYCSMGFFFMSSGQGNLFQENIVHDHVADGIYFRNSATDNFFINNTLYNNNYGLRLIGTSFATIMYNQFFNNDYGSYLWGGGSIVHKNTFWNNTNGLYFVAAGGDTASNNTIYNNTGDGIHLINSNTIYFYNNTVFENMNGINLLNAPNCVVKDNFIYNNTNYGITLYDNYTQLSHNMVSGNDVGFYLGSTSSVSVYSNLSANIIANNREGIRLLKNYNCTIRDNQIYNNSEAGIFLDESHNTVISNNSIRDNSEGIHLWETFNTTIQLNEITNNETGIYLEDALAPKIIYNDIFNNTQCGIYIDNANESLITWNMIFDNGVIIKELSGVNNTIEKNFCYSGTSLDPITPNPSIDGWITLNWDAVSWATYYLVYRRYNVPFTTVYDFVVREPIKNVTTNTALDNNIPAKGMYFYTIIAGNETGWSIWSNNRWVNVTGYPVPESTILDPLITPNYNGQIELRWSVVINATYYYVYRQIIMYIDRPPKLPMSRG